MAIIVSHEKDDSYFDQMAQTLSRNTLKIALYW